MLKQRTLKKAKYRAIIIGAGKIGAQFDTPRTKEILTHAHAYYKHSKVDLIGFFDINRGIAQKAVKKWGGQVFLSFDEITKVNPDIISVCVPDEFHFDVLKKVAKLKPRIVVCEKPITTNSEDTKKIIKIYNKIDIPILVNYSRRFDKTMQAFKDNIDKGKYGKIISASGIYTKGILHNGSHLINLCNYLFGEIKDKNILYYIDDYIKNDYSVGGLINFQKCPFFHLIVGDDKKYPIFELDVLFEKKHINIYDFGFLLSEQDVVNDPHYKGFKCLDKRKKKATGLLRALVNLVDNAVNYLEKGESLICDVEDAYKTQKACFSLLKSQSICQS